MIEGQGNNAVVRFNEDVLIGGHKSSFVSEKVKGEDVSEETCGRVAP
jgi:hypothetical protein